MSAQAQALSIAKTFGMKDLRIQCRARGISPAGGKETLVERLVEDMVATKDFEVRPDPEAAIYNAAVNGPGAKKPSNNYTRPEGQNVGNFITDRPSSRVLAPPGGGLSNFNIGNDEFAPPPRKRVTAPILQAPWATEPQQPRQAAPQQQEEVVEEEEEVLDEEPTVAGLTLTEAVDDADAQATVSVASSGGDGENKYGNNYARPGGQNVGNFITDKPSSRVLAPPGGGSKITFG